MYIKIETRMKTRVSRNSGVYRKFSYDVQTGADIRTGHWNFDDEIMHDGGISTWTLAMISSTRRNGKVRKHRTYLCRISRNDIVVEFKQAHIKGQDFNICTFMKVVTSVETKFPADSERVLAMLTGKLKPIVDQVISEFKGTEEFECFSRYAAMKNEVDTRIKQLNDEDAKRAGDENRRREDYRHRSDEARGSGCDDGHTETKTTHKDRIHAFAVEMANKVARAAKKRYHPDLMKEGDATVKQEKSIIAAEIVDGAVKRLDEMVGEEFEQAAVADGAGGF